MQRKSTPTKKTDLISDTKRFNVQQELSPSVSTIEKILQFSSTYRAEKIADNQYVEWFLN